jgi:hypothetical protein
MNELKTFDLYYFFNLYYNKLIEIIIENATTTNRRIKMSQVDSNETHNDQVLEKFYSISEDYWSKQPATVNGMLGGFDFISNEDIKGSQKFLNSLVNHHSNLI